MLQKELHSYGVIPIFKGEDGFHILLVKNTKGGHWGLPKGTPEEGEKPVETANRELTEETGITNIDVKTDVSFDEEYSFEQGDVSYHKINTYYPGFVTEMTEGTQLDEIDELKWVKLDEAGNTISHDATIDVLKELTVWLSH